MVKTIAEFRDELRTLRDEMFETSERADLKLVASWVDSLAMSLEGLSETLDMHDREIETLSESEAAPEAPKMGEECACPCCCEPMEAPKKAKPKKAKKAKKAKPAKKRRR